MSNQYILHLGEFLRIIIVQGGPMFVTFEGNPFPRINIHMNVYTIIFFSINFFKLSRLHLPTKLRSREPGKFCLPTNMDPNEYNDSTMCNKYRPHNDTYSLLNDCAVHTLSELSGTYNYSILDIPTAEF